MAENPWTPRDPFKKRVITVSVTEHQDEDFERMKAWLGEKSDGAVIKAGLALLWSQMPDNLKSSEPTDPQATTWLSVPDCRSTSRFSSRPPRTTTTAGSCATR